MPGTIIAPVVFRDGIVHATSEQGHIQLDAAISQYNFMNNNQQLAVHYDGKHRRLALMQIYKGRVTAPVDIVQLHRSTPEEPYRIVKVGV